MKGTSFSLYNSGTEPFVSDSQLTGFCIQTKFSLVSLYILLPRGVAVFVKEVDNVSVVIKPHFRLALAIVASERARPASRGALRKGVASNQQKRLASLRFHHFVWYRICI